MASKAYKALNEAHDALPACITTFHVEDWAQESAEQNRQLRRLADRMGELALLMGRRPAEATS